MPVQGQNFDFYLRFDGYELQIKYHSFKAVYIANKTEHNIKSLDL
jgi:hypothetical protein